MKIEMKAREFKRMNDPSARDAVFESSGHVKYVCYIQANSIPQEILEWMETNPREQKLTNYLGKKIKESLSNETIPFHELNRGMVFSADCVNYDNKQETLTVDFESPEIHGNIDGGHTLRAIFEVRKEKEEYGDKLSDQKYVFAEFFVGLNSPVELAAARNTSIQVDRKSLEELKKNFEVLKKLIAPLSFSNRIAYKMNEEEEGELMIDVREVITVLNMFNQGLNPIRVNGGLNNVQPIQSYTGKEHSLNQFIKLEKRDEILLKMEPIIHDVFTLWDFIEMDFPNKVNDSKHKYGAKKYSKYQENKIVGKSLYEEKPLRYLVPKGILYPLVGAFRALVEINPITGEYQWKKDPFEVWKHLGARLAGIIMDEKEENPEYLGKSKNLWSNLFKEVFLYSL